MHGMVRSIHDGDTPPATRARADRIRTSCGNVRHSTSGSVLQNNARDLSVFLPGWTNITLAGRKVFIHVPKQETLEQLPVVIALHGAGQTPYSFAQHFKLWQPEVTATHIVAAPSTAHSCTGWNIANESHLHWDVHCTTRDDVWFVGTLLVHMLSRRANVLPAFSLLGFSQGACLANRILIENYNPQLVAAVTIATQLSTIQYHKGLFHIYSPSNHPIGDGISRSVTGRAVLQLSDVADDVIPAGGGPSRIALLHGQLSFLPWEESARRLALLTSPTWVQHERLWKSDEIGRASCKECRSRWSPYH